ncbi:MAG: hypothetical protein VKQ33_01710 [Candidatus Sericytochromatia bacterium]|nr:hypothetical protein [Candidatus Sericytochromatia bacterium]
MPALHTAPGLGARRTEPATRSSHVDPSDILFGVVKAYNQRHGGRAYGAGETENLFEAVRAFNARRG